MCFMRVCVCVQVFASELHLRVVREYLSPLMKNNYSCRSRKHQRAAAKLRDQWAQIRDLFLDMVRP